MVENADQLINKTPKLNLKKFESVFKHFFNYYFVHFFKNARLARPQFSAFMLSSACCNISTSFFLLKVYNSDQLILQIYTGMFRLGFAFENCKRILKPLLPNSVEQIRVSNLQ